MRLFQEGDCVVLCANPALQGTVTRGQEYERDSTDVVWEGDTTPVYMKSSEIMLESIYRQYHPEDQPELLDEVQDSEWEADQEDEMEEEGADWQSSSTGKTHGVTILYGNTALADSLRAFVVNWFDARDDVALIDQGVSAKREVGFLTLEFDDQVPDEDFLQELAQHEEVDDFLIYSVDEEDEVV